MSKILTQNIVFLCLIPVNLVMIFLREVLTDSPVDTAVMWTTVPGMLFIAYTPITIASIAVSQFLLSSDRRSAARAVSYLPVLCIIVSFIIPFLTMAPLGGTNSY